MKKISHSATLLPQASQSRLGGLFALALKPADTVAGRERRAVFDYHWDATLSITGSARREPEVASQKRLSLNEVFQEAEPSLVLLLAVKEYAKANGVCAASLMDEEVSRLAYFTAIATALLCCKRSITRLSARELRDGFRWGAGQVWAPEWVRRRLKAATASLEAAASVQAGCPALNNPPPAWPKPRTAGVSWRTRRFRQSGNA